MTKLISPVNKPAEITKLNQHWPALRESGKIDRMNFTDAIKRFTEYKDSEGNKSTLPERAYSNFTRTVYAPFGLNKLQRESLIEGVVSNRDLFDLTQLRYIQLAEDTAASILNEGMEAERLRTEIKSTVKDECKILAAQLQRINHGFFSEDVA